MMEVDQTFVCLSASAYAIMYIGTSLLRSIDSSLIQGKQLRLRLTSNDQQYSPNDAAFAVYQVLGHKTSRKNAHIFNICKMTATYFLTNQILRIEPVCSPSIGISVVTVFGDNIVNVSIDYVFPFSYFDFR